MNSRGAIRKGIAGSLAALGACLLAAQAPRPAAAIETSGRLIGFLPSLSAANVIREIEDPSSGARWLLVRDAEHPGGPGRLVLAASSLPAHLSGAAQPMPRAVIHAGDHITVEEHTARVDAVLEAVALAAAASGSLVRARLQAGGRIVRAVATGAGRATLAPEPEGQP